MNDLVITSLGQELMARMIAGTSTGTFTKIEASSHDYADGDIESLRSLLDVKQTALVSNVARSDTTVVEVQAAIDNKELTEGYYVRAIGLYAKDSDDNEILYGVATDPNPDYMPVFGGKTVSAINYKFNVKVDNSAQVTIEINPAASPTMDQFEALEARVESISTHQTKSVIGEEGVHDLRYYDDELQVKGTDGNWQTAGTGGSGGIAPNNVSDFKIKVGNQKLTLTWSDPADTVVEGNTLCSWKGTKLVMKEGAYPTSWKDGTQLVDNQERDKYKTNGYVLENLTNGTTYYFQLFPYSDQNGYNGNAANQKSAVPQPYKTLTVKIDLSNSNPKSCISVEDDLVGMTTDEIKEWFGYYPVLFKDGAEAGKLNPKNYAQFEDGSAADITTVGNDVMIAYPRRGLSITRNGKTITIKFTDEPDNADFKYYAHQRGTTQKDVFYLGAYKGYVTGNKLYSSSGKAVANNQTIGTFRTYAHNRGTGYEQSGFYQLVYRQAMYIAVYQDLDSQSAVGQGYTSNNAGTNTGGANAYGMDSEVIKASNPTYMTDAKHQVKCLGLEDFWGNYWEWIDGIYSDANRHILTGTDNFNDTGSGYTDQGQGASSNISSWMSDCQGTTETGFIAKEVSGSSTTYFCDDASLYASCVACFGGHWNDGAYAGAFRLYVTYAASTSYGNIAARLMYL